MTLKDIAVNRMDHFEGVKTYGENNGKFCASFQEFATEFIEQDRDALIFKWEVVLYEPDNSYYMEVMAHNKEDGKVTMIRIQDIRESDVADIISFLAPHYKKLQQLWLPISAGI